MIRCGICDVTMDKCVCLDADERLRSITDGRVAMKWCRKCDRHYGRCKCEVPQFYVRCGGQDITAQFPQADLSKR